MITSIFAQTEIKYNYLEDYYDFAGTDDALRYNYIEDRYEFAGEDDKLRYNFLRMNTNMQNQLTSCVSISWMINMNLPLKTLIYSITIWRTRTVSIQFMKNLTMSFWIFSLMTLLNLKTPYWSMKIPDSKG